MGTILLYALASAIIASGIYYLVWRYVLNLSGPSEATMKVFDEITQPVLYFDNKALIRYCNAFCQKTLNISQEDFVGLPMQTLFRQDSALEAIKKQVALAGHAGPEKLHLRSGDGSSHTFNLSFSELKGPLGENYGIIAYGDDAREAENLKAELARREITEKNLLELRKSLEETVDQRTKQLTKSIGEARREMNERLKKDELLRSAIKDMEFMLGEINNRQSKNLKLILNMLNSEKWRRDDKRQKQKVEKLYGRIKAMHMVYEHVFYNRNIEYIEFQSFVSELTDRHHSQSGENSRICISINAENHNLQVEQALPLGLICNEMLYEAFRFASFDQQSKLNEKREISVSFTYNRLYNHFVFAIAVSGGGKARTERDDANEIHTLQLAKMLARDQLNGKLTFTIEDTFNARVSFSKMKEIASWQLN